MIEYLSNFIQGNIDPARVTRVAALMKSFLNATEVEIKTDDVGDLDNCGIMLTEEDSLLRLVSREDFVSIQPETRPLMSRDDGAEVVIIHSLIFLLSLLLVTLLLSVISLLTHVR